MTHYPKVPIQNFKFCIAEPCSQIKDGLNGKTGVFSFLQAAELSVLISF